MSHLTHLAPICRAVAHLLPGQVEVVLHDLESGRIAAIENSFSPRACGDDSLSDIGDFQSELGSDDTIGPYLKSGSDGAKLRSVSALVRDEEGKPVALFCVNLRVDILEQARDVLAAFTQISEPPATQILRNDWREVANAIIAATLKELKLSFNQLRRSEREIIVERLICADIFAARGSIDYVAKALGVSRATLYTLIKTHKKS
ncbi:MAG: PAS domain-containing protein [Cohaesibacter sp.]|jgi:predicted transcriptional regulator YheO|nr:PAS domain-containing protein [Cohaesibacter sp.]